MMDVQDIRNDLTETRNVTGLCGMINAGARSCTEKGLKGLVGTVDRLSGHDFLWFRSVPFGLQKVRRSIHPHRMQ